MRKHRSLFIDDEAEDDKTTSKKRKKNLTCFRMVNPGIEPHPDPLQDSSDGGDSSNSKKCARSGNKLKLITPEKPSPEPLQKRARLEEVKGSTKDYDGVDDDVETLISNPIGFVMEKVKARLPLDRKKIDLYAETLAGGLTIVYSCYHKSSEGGFLMQGVVAAGDRGEPFKSMDVRKTSCFSLGPNSDEPKTNADGYRENVFVMVNRFCVPLNEGGMSCLLDKFAVYLNEHTFTKARGLVKERPFSRYSVPIDCDKTSKPILRKLGDVIILSDAIEMVRLMFDDDKLREANSRKKIVSKYFNPPYPQSLQIAFGFP